MSKKNLAALDGFKTSNLSKKSQSMANESDAIQTAPISLFHEDPKNSRLKFDEDSLNELAATMAEKGEDGKPRGILEPVSVRKHPNIDGAFMINGGHRRVRAAKIAGIEEVPFYVRNNFNAIDNYLLNMYEALSAHEQAQFIIEQVNNEGMTASELAKAIGKPNSFISDHIAFGELSEYIAKLYQDGLCTSIQALAALHRADKKFPIEVQAFCSQADKSVSTAEAKAFAKSLREQSKSESVEDEQSQSDESSESQEADDRQGNGDSVVTSTESDNEAEQSDNEDSRSTTSPSTTSKHSLKGRVVVEHLGENGNFAEGYILTNKPSDKEGWVWVNFSADSVQDPDIDLILASELTVKGII